MRECDRELQMGLNKRRHLPGVFGLAVFVLGVLGFLATADLPVLGHLSAAEVEHHRVDARWLLAEMDKPDLVILDTRSRADYLEGHIRGAVSLPVWETFGEDPRSDLVAPISRIQALFSRAGVDQQTRVVLYDGGEMINAARVFWVLEMHGHQRVSVLSPGFRDWSQAGLPVENRPVEPVPRRFLSHVTSARLATRLSTRLAINDPATVIVDAREPEEYAGIESTARRFGHIPSAISIPYSENFTSEGNALRSFEELEALYRGIPRDRKVITYCNKGRQSALTYFILRELGYEVSAYDGSWFEWGNDTSLPIVRDEQQGSARDSQVSD